MLQDQILLVVVLLMSVSLLTIISEKLRIPYPIFLVICGLFIGFIPNVLEFVLVPDLVFLIFLPPLLFAAAWNTSWKDFWSLRRSISLLAFGLVIFTSCAVAVVSKSLIPGFTFALGFLLGGIISPTDPIAATSVLRKMKMPKRVVDILEGESLIMAAGGSDALEWDSERSKGGKAARDWLRTKANSIEGGTSEIQLGIVAKHILRLPGT